MDDISVLLEHVDLLNGLDRLDVELLQRGLELLVIGARAGRRPLNLTPGSTLATIQPSSLVHHAHHTRPSVYFSMVRGGVAASRDGGRGRSCYYVP